MPIISRYMYTRSATYLAIFIVIIGFFTTDSDAKWFGDSDPRYKKDAYITSADMQKKYSGVGRIICRTNEYRINNGNKERLFINSTAFHLSNFNVMITTSHSFFLVDKISGEPTEAVSPQDCTAIFRDYDGNVLEEIEIDRIYSRWSDRKFFGDKSQDIAIVLLKKESTTPTQFPGFLISTREVRKEGLKINIVGFSDDLKDSNIKRIGNGVIFPDNEIYLKSINSITRTKQFSNSLVFVGDYASGPGSSGSPIFNDMGRVIGINQGTLWRTVKGIQDRKFSIEKNYNRGILFDQRFYDDLKAISTSSGSFGDAILITPPHPPAYGAARPPALAHRSRHSREFWGHNTK